jgi:zinc transport system substrate-binding protein
VVASTSWVAAFAEAAGATDVRVIAPASVQHPPDYDPRPGDLAAAADADYVLFSEFDGFAARIQEAAAGGELVPVQLENTPSVIRSEVTRLGELFGTQDWLTGFDAEYAELSGQVRAALPDPAPPTIAHVFMAYWGAGFAGLPVTGTYGPMPVTPGELADLPAAAPRLELANAHLPGSNPDVAGATRVELVNFPGEDLDLLEVFRTNADRLTAALSAL